MEPAVLVEAVHRHPRLLQPGEEIELHLAHRPLLRRLHLQLEPAPGRGDRLVARLRRADGGEESCEAAYVAGCDGAHSKVREVLGLTFSGGTYAHMFYVADTQASGPVVNHELHVALDEAEFVAAFPLKRDGRVRLIGVVRDSGATTVFIEHDMDVVARYAERVLVFADGSILAFQTFSDAGIDCSVVRGVGLVLGVGLHDLQVDGRRLDACGSSP